jgi:hypothetical protein
LNQKEEQYYMNRIRELYIDYKYNKYEVMSELNISENEFDTIRFRYSIERTDRKNSQKINASEYKNIYEMNTIQKMAIKNIAKKYHVNNRTIYRIIDKWKRQHY